MKTLGVFDIGSNTVLLTLGRRDDSGKTEVFYDAGEVVRLSEGLKDGAPLQAAPRARVLDCIRAYQKIAAERGVSHLIAAGTAAFRRASDGVAFAAEIQQQTGIPVRILSGEEEAAYSYASAWHDFGSQNQELGMIDIGGGSTELVFSRAGPRFSLPVGTVRLTEHYVSAHPIPDPEWEHIHRAIASELNSTLKKDLAIPSTWVAVAATPASLAALLMQLKHYDPDLVHGYIITRNALATLVEVLRNKSQEERKMMPGMDPKRAELLPVGGLILLSVVDALQLPQITVSDHGLRYGILFEELAKA